MTTAQALTAFMVHYAQWLNLSGDSERFFKIKTADRIRSGAPEVVAL